MNATIIRHISRTRSFRTWLLRKNWVKPLWCGLHFIHLRPPKLHLVQQGNTALLRLFFSMLLVIFILMPISAHTVHAQVNIQPFPHKGISDAPQDSELVQLCVHENTAALSEHQLPGFVIGVTDNSLRFRLESVFPQLTFRLFSAEQGLIRIDLQDAIARGQLSVWWCNTEQAEAHAQNDAQVLTLSATMPASIFISEQSLDTYFHANAQRMSLRPQELLTIYALGTMRIGVPDDSAPILDRDDSGQIRGFDADVLALLAERLSLPITWHDCGSWRTCIAALESRDIDALSFMTPTSERLQFAAFTVPYFSVDWALMSLSQNPVRGTDLASVSDATIAIVESYSIFADAMAVPELRVLSVATPEDGINAVLEGRADAYLDSLPLLMNRVRQQALSGTAVHILRALPGDRVSIGVRNDWQELVPILDRAILLTSDNEIAQVQEAWFEPEQLTDGLDRDAVQRWAVRSIIAVLIILAGFLAWLTHLRRDIQRRKLREAEMRHRAYHDQLTGLPNRTHMIEKGELALILHAENKRKCALIFIDLDGFKAVNDTEGHDAGDELLIAVAQRIQRAVRKTDMVARYGGDEFVILLTQINTVEQAKAVADKVLQRLTMPFRLAVGEAKIGASIGVAVYPDHGQSYEQLLIAADEAMYAVKESGKQGVIVAKPVAKA